MKELRMYIFKIWEISAAHCTELQFVTMISSIACVLLWASGQCSPCDSCGDTAGSAASPHQHNHISKCYTCQSISRGGVSICSVHTGVPFKTQSNSRRASSAGTTPEFFGGKSWNFPWSQLSNHDCTLLLLKLQEGLKEQIYNRATCLVQHTGCKCLNGKSETRAGRVLTS